MVFQLFGKSTTILTVQSLVVRSEIVMARSTSMRAAFSGSVSAAFFASSFAFSPLWVSEPDTLGRKVRPSVEQTTFVLSPKMVGRRLLICFITALTSAAVTVEPSARNSHHSSKSIDCMFTIRAVTMSSLSMAFLFFTNCI